MHRQQVYGDALETAMKKTYHGSCHCGAVRLEADLDLSSINLACLDNIQPSELVEPPVKFMNGRDNDWWHEPSEVRHL
jgi:hypothetical protein